MLKEDKSPARPEHAKHFAHGLLNFGDAPQAVPLRARGKVRLSTRLDDPPEEPCDCVCLRAKEGVIVECAGGM